MKGVLWRHLSYHGDISGKCVSIDSFDVPSILCVVASGLAPFVWRHLCVKGRLSTVMSLANLSFVNSSWRVIELLCSWVLVASPLLWRWQPYCFWLSWCVFFLASRVSPGAKGLNLPPQAERSFLQECADGQSSSLSFFAGLDGDFST